jgi:hypothetical protein
MVALSMLAHPGLALAQQPTVEPLLEVPLHRIPKTVTYEDYQDANRRVGLAVFYGLLPGGVHAYGNEKTTGWVLSGTATAGLVAIVSGLTLTQDGSLAADGYGTVAIGGRSFYQVPVEMTGDNTTFRLKEVPESERELTETGKSLVGLGVLAVLGSYFYDFYYGIRLIETKRDKARYKIGKAISHRGGASSLRLTMIPTVDPKRKSAGLSFRADF